MAKKGLKHPVFAPFASEIPGQLPTYGVGAEVGWAIEANEAIEYNDAKLYANDTLAESDNSFRGGKLTTGLDDLSRAIKKLWFGTQEVTEGGTVVLKDAVQYAAPYGGFGYYGIRQIRGVRKIESHWYYKTLWLRPNNTSKTKGESTEWQTPSVEGTIFGVNDTDGSWHKEAEFNTEAEAVAWLDGLANIVTPDALALSSSSPVDGASGSSKTAAITLTFNNVMNQNTTKAVLIDDGGNVIVLTPTWDATGKIATLAHAALTGTTEHFLTYCAVDAYGQALIGAISFITAA